MKFVIEERQSDSPFVDRVWRAQSEDPGTFISQAKTCGMIVVTWHRGKAVLTLRGPETKATPMDYTWIDAEFVGIDFKLGAFLPHFPPGTLLNQNDVNLPMAGSQSFWLRGSAWQFPDYENADTFVDRLIREDMLVHESVVDAVVQNCPQDLSIRATQYRFLHATGLNYRTVQQIERAHYAANLLEQGVSILDTIFEAGYFDQPHLTRSLKRYLGQTPAQIVRAIQPQ